MSVSELCKDGINLRLFREDERLFLQVIRSDQDEETREGAMPCDPDVLASVIRGNTYQLASEHSYCVVRRMGPTVTLEFQMDDKRQSCSISVEEFSRLLEPVLPARLRATLI